MNSPSLVSDGHILAAKLRSVMPRWSFVAIVLVALGAVGLMVSPWPATLSVQQGFSSDSRAYDGRAIRAFFNTLPEAELLDDAYSSLAPAYEIERILPLITDSLNETGDLPDTLDFDRINHRRFWDDDWSPSALRMMRRGDTIVIGAILSHETEITAERQAADPIRWIGLFRRYEGEWHDYSLRFDGAYLPPATSGAVIDPATLPQTMRRLLPASAFEEEAS